MILENKEYRLSNKLDLSEQPDLVFDFYIDFYGTTIKFIGLYSDGQSLYYRSEDDEIIVYDEEFGWEVLALTAPDIMTGALLADAFRTIILPSTQEVEGGEWILNNLRKPATNPQLINFTVKEWPDQTFQAAVNSTWTMYEPSSYNPGISALQSGKMAYDGQFLIYNSDGTLVKLTDQIKENGVYSMPSQIAVGINFSNASGAVLDPLHTEVSALMGEFVTLQSGEKKTIPLYLDEDWHVQNIPFTWVNDYLGYELHDNALILSATTFPQTYYESLVINLPKPQKTLVVKLDTAATVDDGDEKISELHPSLYRVNVKGSYFSGNFHSLKIESIFNEGTYVVGTCVASELMAMFKLYFSDGTIVADSELQPIGIPQTLSVLFTTSILEYINQEVDATEVYGDIFYTRSRDIEKIKSFFITQQAKNLEITEAEFVAQIKAKAAEQGITYDECLVDAIETKHKAEISELSIFEPQTIDSENFETLVELVQNSVLARQILANDEQGIISLLFPSFLLLQNESEGVIPQVNYTYSAGDTRDFGLFYNSNPVKTNTIFSENNDFDFTLGESWSISNYTAPVDKLTPGSISVSYGTGSGDGDGTGCLSGDTLISTPEGDRRIDSIFTGDIILTPRGPEKVIYSNAYLDRKGEYFDDYYFSDSKVLRVIHNHRIYSVDRGCVVLMSNLREGEQVAVCGATAKFLRKERHNEQVNYYSLWTENSNLYYANGILCGNYFSNFKPAWLRKIAVRLRCWVAKQRGKRK